MSEEDYPDIERITIKSEKELVSEFENFDKLLVDTNKDWNHRLKAIKRLEGIILGGGFEFEDFPALLTKIYLHINAQLNDLRSAISKEACKLVCIAAEYGQELIENLCDKLLSKQCLLKLINSATKIISENGHECIITLLNYIKCSKVIPRIIEEVNSKNMAVRQKISQYLNIIVDTFEQHTLEKYQHILEEAITTLICDANKEARQFTRQTFSIYADKFPARGEKMFSTFEASVTKTLIDEGLVDPTIAYLKKSSSISSSKEIKSAQRPASSSAKKGDSKSVYSSPTSNLGRTSGSNGFGSENPVKGSPLTRSTTTALDEERPLRQSDMYAERKVGASKGKMGFEKKKSVEVSSAEIKTVSKSISEESTRPPTRASSKVSGQRMKTNESRQQFTPSLSRSDLDYENSSYQSRREEELYALLDQTNSESWATRVSTFEEINEFISDLKPNEQLSNNLMDQLIQAHIQHMNDHHYKVVIACQESFSRLLTIYNSKVLSYLDQIIPLLFVNLTEGKEKVSASTNFLINLINKIYSGDELIPHFLRSLESSSKIKYKTSMVEFMNILIRNCDTYFNTSNGIRTCVAKFAYIIGEQNSTKSIVMPCLGMILYLRDINLNATVAAICTLSSDLISKIRNLAAEYAPDLEENINLYLSQNKGGFARNEARLSTSASTTNTNKAEALQNKTNNTYNSQNRKSNVELRSKPIPESDLNGYNYKEKTEKSVERDTKKPSNAQRSNSGYKPSYANVSLENKGGKSSRNPGSLKSEESTMTSIKTKSIQKNVQEEDNSSRESDNGPLYTDVDDFLQAESKANNPTDSEESKEEEDQDEVSELAKIDNLLSGFPKTKNEIQKRLDNIVASILTSIQSDDPKILEYTLGIFKNLLKIPIDLSEQIQELVSGIISLFNVPIKTGVSIDELLKSALELGYIEQCLPSLIAGLDETDHPVVQIIIKSITRLILQDENETYLELLPELITKYKELIHHSNPDVRKNVVFSIVELYFINQDELEKYVETFSPNHQKLISIYIQKKSENHSLENTAKK